MVGLQWAGLRKRIAAADERYGPFKSTHEALGVAIEEWDELRAAVHANDLDAIRHEALDLAACLIRLYDNLGSSIEMQIRSEK